jgi:SAM-dependent methyltransferase
MENIEYKLNIREKIFKSLYCYSEGEKNNQHEGGESHEDTKSNDTGSLIRFENYFGLRFLDEINGNVVVDLGCGEGEELITVVEKGAKYGIGVDIQENYMKSIQRAEKMGLNDKLHYTNDPLVALEPSSVDVIMSQNSFEHFSNPDEILSDAHRVLKSGGKFFITFSPPWLHPYGVHMFFMIKRPWAHVFFSEKTILNVRRLYRSDGAKKYEEVEGGLNKMTIKKFINYINESNFKLEFLHLNPIRGLPSRLTYMPLVREFTTGAVSAVLVK